MRGGPERTPSRRPAPPEVHSRPSIQSVHRPALLCDHASVDRRERSVRHPARTCPTAVARSRPLVLREHPPRAPPPRPSPRHRHPVRLRSGARLHPAPLQVREDPSHHRRLGHESDDPSLTPQRGHTSTSTWNTLRSSSAHRRRRARSAGPSPAGSGDGDSTAGGDTSSTPRRTRGIQSCVFAWSRATPYA
jgi:hypothetical protein